MERLRSDAKFVPEMTEALKSFANEGLRTLVIAQRYLNESDWRVWDQVRATAVNSDGSRAVTRSTAHWHVLPGHSSVELKVPQSNP